MTTLGSLFDGIGGFPFAATIAGIKPIWAAEIDPACVAVTRQHFPDMLHYGDVSKINGAEIPPVDIITFGSPCQDLSIAGKRAGLDGERSGLFSEAVRIIYEMRLATNGKYPTFIIWENVPGAFSSNRGKDFQTVLQEITKTEIPIPTSGKWATAGMVRSDRITAAWRQLDAQYWGVPQRRKRIYLIGSFGNDSAAEILFKPDSVQRYLTPCGAERQRVADDTETGVGRSNFIFDARGNGNGDIAPTITGDHNSRITDYSAVVMQPIPINEQLATRHNKLGERTGLGIGKPGEAAYTITAGHPHIVCCINDQGGESISVEKGNYSPTLRSQSHGNEPIVLYALDRASFNQGENAKYDFDISDKGVNSTLVSQGPSAVAYGVGNGQANNSGLNKIEGALNCMHDQQAVMYKVLKWIVRRLTPLECERLQGYPDYWTELPKIEDMTDDEYSFFLRAFMLDKAIKGQEQKKPPTKASLVKWYNKLDCDGNRYKMCGNSLAIPCALRVLGGIADYISKERER